MGHQAMDLVTKAGRVAGYARKGACPMFYFWPAFKLGPAHKQYGNMRETHTEERQQVRAIGKNGGHIADHELRASSQKERVNHRMIGPGKSTIPDRAYQP